MAESRDPTSREPAPEAGALKRRGRLWRWKFWRARAAVKEAPPTGEDAEFEAILAPKRRFWRRKGSGGENPGPKRVPWIRRSRWRVIVLRTLSWGFIALVLLCLAVYGGIRVLVKPVDIAAFIKQQVEEQTGGRLDIGSVKFDVMSGIRLADVQFYPPAAGDTRGSHYGGAVELVPLANFAALDVRYSVAKALAGRIHIKALQLIQPEFHLKQTDGVFNFDSILAYRQRQFPPKPEDQKKAEEPQPGAQPGDSLLPFNPALIYLPFDLLAQNIGIKDLRLDLIKEDQGKITRVLTTNGLSFDCGLHWFLRDSSIWFTMMNPFEHPLELDIREAKDGGELQPSLLVRSALSLRFELTNLKKISVDFATRLLTLETPIAGYKNLGTFVKMRLTVADDYKGLSFDTFDAELADALAYELAGTISVSDATFQAINLHLKQKFNLDLEHAAALAKPFVPSLKASGEIAFDELKVEGTVEPAKLKDAANGVALPYVSGVVWLEDVAVDYPETGVSMDPISGAVSLAVGPSLNAAGSQVDLSVDVKVPRLEAQQTVPEVGEVKAGVENLTAKVTARALWPEMILPILKVNVEAEHVKASGQHIAPIDAPLFVDIDADGRQDLARAALSANVELTDLVEFTAMADCQAKCTSFRSNVMGRVDTLEKVHAIALPLGATLGLGDFMPTKLTGAVDFQLAARGKLPDPLTTPVPELLKALDLRFNSQLSLTKLNAKVPFFDVDLKNFETRVLAAGTMAEQKIDISQKFDRVTLKVPKGEDQPPMPVAVDRFSLETSVANTVEGPLDLKTVLAQLSTGVDTKLYIGKVSVDGTLPRPIADFQFAVSAEQAHLTDIKVKDLSVRLPDYGTVVGFNADTTVGPDFMPKRLKANVTTQITHTGEEKLPLGVKTSGRIDVKLSVDSPDMRNVAVDGETAFDKFNVTIPSQQDAKAPPLLVVEDIRGQIPFKQIVKIPDLKELKAAPKAQDPSAAPAAVAAADKSPAGAGAKDAAKAAVPEVRIKDEGDTPAETASDALDQVAAKYFEKTADALVKNTNIVAMVDYGTIRPFYPERRPLSIKRVEAANLELSNMEFDLELRQNWFALNQYVINFLGGKIQGDLQLAFDPTAKDPKEIPRSLRTSVHMTRLDTRKLIERFPNLKGKESSGWDLFSNPYIDGTVHLNYDLAQNDLSGGVEITSIGKEQLRMMLYYVDPFEQNPTISSIRKALALGDVRQVSIPLKNGEVGMDVDVRVLGAPVPTPKLTRFPISQILQNFKDQAGGGKDKPSEAPKTPPVEAQSNNPQPATGQRL